MRIKNGCVACLLFFLACSVPATEVKLVAPRPVVWRDFLGVNAHFLWFTPQQAALQMDRLRDLGLEWTRVDLHWDRHEAKENDYLFKPIDTVVDALKDKQLKSVFYLVGSAPFASSAPLLAGNKDQYPPKDNEVFAKRMGMLAKRYPSVDAWQVWNEPNLPAFWRPAENAADYGRMLQSSVRVLKQIAPSKPVVMAGMAYYSQMPIKRGLMLEELGKKGALGLGAIVAYHPYSQEPEGDDVKERDFILRSKEINQRLRAMKVPGIWATEWGWSSYAGPKEEQSLIGEAGQADYLLRRLVLMSVSDFDRVFLFALSDLDSRAGVRDRSYGLLDLQGKPKPAYKALAQFLKITGPSLSPGEAPSYKGSVNGLYSIAWKKPDGSKLWMFWADEAGVIDVAGVEGATLYQPLSGAKTALKSGRLAVTHQLQILEWR
ncbi:cellulase family glycosylhydrolase [Iodobacter sp. CM08]|uniref:cellulase family glycosylhydrolase n=1 Tax=Iodobacter sp. CM08 TaxID=3085902 RepID=UPI002981122A|nr:cellulase family glycosylhydrolase [Iodobacter sp. CM08]MDW5419020.1 cellulase family glycosylhydrolase [Iodobacter sp. CM08]